MEAAFNIKDYTTEATVRREDSPLAGKTVGDLEGSARDEIEVITLMRGGADRRYGPPARRSSARRRC